MRIYDPTKFKNIKPVHAEGHICIDLTDPLTGKVKERIKGTNHVFTDSLFSEDNFDWVSSVSKSWLCLNDSAAAIDTTIPYLFGQTVGYGIPSSGSLGSYRGAYNDANQVLAQMSLTGARWKFQYDFTTAQANGIAIGTIGLTQQYAANTGLYPSPKKHLSGFHTGENSNPSVTCDGRYAYVCSTAGSITKYDLWLDTSTTIDISATVGTTSKSYKTVGYAPATGKYYIYVYSSTASLRKMYVFSDSSFSTLENTYSPTNVAVSGSSGWPLYICGTTAYWFHSADNTIWYADFVSNVAYSTITISDYNNAAYTEHGINSGNLGRCICPLNDKYVFCEGSTASPTVARGVIFDISTGTVVGCVTGHYGPSSGYATCASCLHPLLSEKIVCNTKSGMLHHKAAIAAYKLPETVTKTSANGMTATYELEVFW